MVRPEKYASARCGGCWVLVYRDCVRCPKLLGLSYNQRARRANVLCDVRDGNTGRRYTKRALRVRVRRDFYKYPSVAFNHSRLLRWDEYVRLPGFRSIRLHHVPLWWQGPIITVSVRAVRARRMLEKRKEEYRERNGDIIGLGVTEEEMEKLRSMMDGRWKSSYEEDGF